MYKALELGSAAPRLLSTVEFVTTGIQRPISDRESPVHKGEVALTCMLFVFSLASIQTGSAETVLRCGKTSLTGPNTRSVWPHVTWMFQGGSILSLPPLFQALSAAHSLRWQNAASEHGCPGTW